LAADLESNEGFNSGISQSGVRGAQAIICHHEDSVLGITQQLRQVMRQSSPPTAILVTNAHYYLTVIGCLQQMGRQVPRDISLLSRNDDPFLSYITPTPARYVFDPQTMANGVLHLVKTWLETGKPPAQSVRLMPRFIHGESLRGPMAIHPG